MEICKVDKSEYEEQVKECIHAFQSVTFNELNKDKCDELLYFLFKDTKYRLGLILGATNKALQSPFSAPMGGFSPISTSTKIGYFDDALIALKQWAKENEYKSIEFYLPPEFYHENLIAKQVNTLWRHEFIISNIDLNYAFHLSSFNDEYQSQINYNARKNLKISLKANLSFELCTDIDTKQQAYLVIKQNRENKGFPLRMTWEQVAETVKIINSDFFLVKDSSGKAIASAIIFHVAPKVVQVVYWGDIFEYSKLKTMNFLSFKVFEYYKSKNFEVVDLGISTVDSEPNHGLAEFKESIGCSVSPKFKFKYKTN